MDRTPGIKLVIADFGLARVLAPTGEIPLPSSTHPYWCAPEVLQHKKGSRAGDVYSFGIVMWEMLTWDMPFQELKNPEDAWLVRYQQGSASFLRFVTRINQVCIVLCRGSRLLLTCSLPPGYVCNQSYQAINRPCHVTSAACLVRSLASKAW